MAENHKDSGKKKKKKEEEGTAEQYSSTFVYLMTFGASLGALNFGYNVSIVSGMMLYAQTDFDMDINWQTLIVGGSVISATVSAMTAGFFTDKLGRRLTLLMTAALCVAGPVLAAAAPNKEVLCAGRVVVGLTFPLTLAYCPLYIAEMSPVSIRGRLTILNQLQVASGRLLAAILAGAFSYLPSQQWRFMQGFAAVPALMFTVAVFLLPDTPRWLVAKGRHREAARVLQRIYGEDDVVNRIKDIEDSIAASPPAGVWMTLSRVVRAPHMLKALAVGSCLTFFFVGSGINVILFYCGTLMKAVGFPVDYAVWVQGVVPLAMFLSVFPGLLAVEKYGRRPVVLFSLGGSALSMVVAAIGAHLTTADQPPVHAFNGSSDLLLHNINNVTNGSVYHIVDSATSGSIYHLDSVTNGSIPHVDSVCQIYSMCESCIKNSGCGLCYNEERQGFCLPALNQRFSTVGPCSVHNQRDAIFKFAADFCPTPYTWVVVAGVFLYCLFFSVGMAGVTFTILAEIYPTWARSTCLSLVLTLFWVCVLAVSFSFLYMMENLKLYGTFWLFAALGTIGFVLLAIFLPETKNKTLEEVEELFMTSQQLERYRQQKESRQGNNSDKEHIQPLIEEKVSRI